ncbi:MAG: hypothetical protein GY842_25370 [bacterium]|nr:hypothetical protein [bacterium]
MDAPETNGFVFENRTSLNDQRLRDMCVHAVSPWRLGRLEVRVRYSRGADFSGTCYYNEGRIFVNLGRHLQYPYRMGTHIARSVSNRDGWWKPIYTIDLADGYQVVLFVFLHECFHWLVKRARKNPRQKESMCDRFATRILVEQHGMTVRDPDGCALPREAWDFQDVEGFISPLLRKSTAQPPRPHAALVPRPRPRPQQQLLLFDL